MGTRPAVVDQKFADGFDFDVLDATKIIPEELVPVRKFGRLVLDRTVDNFFAETEQVAFCTQNIVPGIDFTNDPLLQGRNFSYLDTQVKRLGGPTSPTAHQRAEMPVPYPAAGRTHGVPQSQGPGELRAEFLGRRGGGATRRPERASAATPPVEGEKQRGRPERFADHYSQARHST